MLCSVPILSTDMLNYAIMMPFKFGKQYIFCRPEIKPIK